MLFLASNSWASTGDSDQPNETLLQDDAEEECYCSVRKQKQVERRLEKQKQKELEQE